MRFLLALAMLSLALFVGSAAVAEGNVPGFGTEDSCAAAFGVEDASACGGNGLTWHFYTREERGWLDLCWYDVRNGGVHAYYGSYAVTSAQSCPNLS